MSLAVAELVAADAGRLRARCCRCRRCRCRCRASKLVAADAGRRSSLLPGSDRWTSRASKPRCCRPRASKLRAGLLLLDADAGLRSLVAADDLLIDAIDANDLAARRPHPSGGVFVYGTSAGLQGDQWTSRPEPQQQSCKCPGPHRDPEPLRTPPVVGSSRDVWTPGGRNVYKHVYQSSTERKPSTQGRRVPIWAP